MNTLVYLFLDFVLFIDNLLHFRREVVDSNTFSGSDEFRKVRVKQLLCKFNGSRKPFFRGWFLHRKPQYLRTLTASSLYSL